MDYVNTREKKKSETGISGILNIIIKNKRNVKDMWTYAFVWNFSKIIISFIFYRIFKASFKNTVHNKNTNFWIEFFFKDREDNQNFKKN